MQTEVNKLIVAISSRALFDLDASNQVFEREGVEAYRKYQIEHEDEPLPPGDAFHLVKKLLHINNLLQQARVEVILLSRNTADTGLRIFNSIKHHGLDISKAAFCGGDSPYRYITAFNSHLFLSTNGYDVRQALEHGVAAATILPSKAANTDDYKLRFAFDGDAVLFSDEAERVFQSEGLSAFQAHEHAKASQPLLAGPFKPLLAALHRLQQEGTPAIRVRTALVTARSAPAHERAIRTLMQWNIEVDEAMFLGGLPKGEFLKEFEPDFFFDDQTGHIESAAQHVPAGHVASGISNPPPSSTPSSGA